MKDYWYRIEQKTALLISASCKLGAVACGADKDIYMPLARYGHRIGFAFQIIDDILDMVADQQQFGKMLGGDLHQGILTLPVIYALKNSPERNRLIALVENKHKTNQEVAEAIAIVKQCGGIDYANRMVNKNIQKAKQELDRLPDVQTKATLSLIADFVRYRKF